MNKQQEALKLALEALKELRMLGMNAQWHDSWLAKPNEAITAIREALAEQPRLLSAAPCDQCGYNGPGYYQPDTHQCAAKHHKALAEQPAQQQEPVAWADINALTEQFNSVNCGTAYRLPGESRQPFYTSPPASKPWVGLSNDEIYDMYNEPRSDAEMVEFARAIEAKLKERNT